MTVAASDPRDADMAFVCDLVMLPDDPLATTAHLCRSPYAGHPKGCPNFNTRGCCPPVVRRMDEIADLRHRAVAVVNDFDLAAHVAKMKAKHPKWTDRQARCCLYWQGTARNQLFRKCGEALQRWPRRMVVPTPEAHGVNVTATLRQIGIELEWPPVRIVRQVAFLVVPK